MTGVQTCALPISSALGVDTFIKHSSLIQYSPAALQKMSGAIQALAKAEGLPSHADSVRLRTQNKDSWGMVDTTPDNGEG